MTAGVAAAKAGNLAEARRHFTRAVALTPMIAESHAALGSVLLSLGEFNAAVAELDSAHKLAPTDSSIDLNLANAETFVGGYAHAVDLFREALASDQA